MKLKQQVSLILWGPIPCETNANGFSYSVGTHSMLKLTQQVSLILWGPTPCETNANGFTNSVATHAM